MFRFFYSSSHRIESRLCCNTPFSSRMAIGYQLTGLMAVISFGLTIIVIQYKSIGLLPAVSLQTTSCELRYTQGLAHCTVTTCFMCNAEGGNPTNEEKEFCAGYKAVFAGQGWKFDW